MAMTAGTTALESGSLAEAIYDNLVSELGDPGDSAGIYEGIAAAVAQAVVSHISANADVTITTSDGALQRTPTLSDTAPPSANRVLAGAVS